MSASVGHETKFPIGWARERAGPGILERATAAPMLDCIDTYMRAPQIVLSNLEAF